MINEINKLKRKFVEVIVILTRICRSKIVKEFKNIEVSTILEDAKLLLTIKDIRFLTMCEDINFLIVLIDSISREKLFSFIIKKCVKEK